jgi:hypothetical protein
MMAKTGLTSTDGTSLADELERLRPFAIINEVFGVSRAEKADLQNGDFLLTFGNASRSAAVPSQVQEGYPVNPSGRNILDITVVPARWEGAGLIGAHLQPYP